MKGNAPVTGRERLLAACHAMPTDRPPIWMMRQAGRSLPEYLKMKQGARFTELVKDPQKAAEITLQPMRRFGYDAAVIFSDILAVAEALGVPYELQEEGGLKIDFALDSAADVEQLNLDLVLERFSHTAETIRLVRKALGEGHGIIGFAGSPWTLASFMVEGGSSRENLRSRAVLHEDPGLIEALIETITAATTICLKAQIAAGVDVVQLFDSQGGTLSKTQWWKASGRWMQQIIRALEGAVPAIVFGRGVHHSWPALVNTGAQVLSIDWSIDLAETARQLPARIAVQGNLDPALLISTPAAAAAETNRILESMRGRDGFIFNLGHGVPPDASIETIQAVTATVQQFK